VSGPSGPSGGPSGPSGIQGPSGPTGPSGPQGQTGIAAWKQATTAGPVTIAATSTTVTTVSTSPVDSNFIFTASFQIDSNGTGDVTCTLSGTGLNATTVHPAGAAFTDSASLTGVAHATSATLACTATAGTVTVSNATLVAVQLGNAIP
jgi:hypothetical protein